VLKLYCVHQNAVLIMDESVLDMDQIENLIKFCPTKEEMDMLKVKIFAQLFVKIEYLVICFTRLVVQLHIHSGLTGLVKPY
jgi:hypothetical protein